MFGTNNQTVYICGFCCKMSSSTFANRESGLMRPGNEVEANPRHKTKLFTIRWWVVKSKKKRGEHEPTVAEKLIRGLRSVAVEVGLGSASIEITDLGWA
ncbi:hypothetical protein L6452_08202 [Arctium lappa]|uniref:Uncharacterized protein n=1 Tax=Arctium lappa TaxID=4217 RepID=A0ACB9DGK3_ARCLA|nr:hypothetical protein L6452_08202 [Arctium lappa]